MNTLPSLRAPGLGLPGAGGWPSPTATFSGPAGGSSPQRWLDGLAGTDGAVLSADLAPGATGLGAAEHAQRVLAALLAE